MNTCFLTLKSHLISLMMSSESRDIDETLMKYVTMRCQAIIQQIVLMLMYKRILRLFHINKNSCYYTEYFQVYFYPISHNSTDWFLILNHLLLRVCICV